ncbi:MAG: hypothetical protein DI537_52395 [Stutzerimonas stutzeri]|nr:MAG: hypothetical protein DI537_52395 [Stutzerimonas stutzeri]
MLRALSRLFPGRNRKRDFKTKIEFGLNITRTDSNGEAMELSPEELRRIGMLFLLKLGIMTGVIWFITIMFIGLLLRAYDYFNEPLRHDGEVIYIEKIEG